MLANMHRIALKLSWARKVDRRVVSMIKRALNVPDAYIEMANIFRHVPGAVVLDIGSHEGDTVLKMLDYMPEAQIHAFEPTPSTAEVLRQRLRGKANVQVHQVALCDRTGTVRLQCNRNEQTNSVLRNVHKPAPVTQGGQTPIREIDVGAETLDDWIVREQIHNPLIVKADIQGAETLLIKGGKKSFVKQIVLFYSEISILPQYEGQADFSEIHNLLTRHHQFALVDIFPCGRDRLGRAAFTDALWVRMDVLETLASRACVLGENRAGRSP